MTTIRTIAAYLILFCGLVLTFAVFFGVITAAALFLGVGWAGIAFLLQVGGLAALLFRAFGDGREEVEQADFTGWDEHTAVEGVDYQKYANVHVMPLGRRG